MADDFQKSVDFGRKLSKRIYYGKEPSMKPPKPSPAMENSPEVHLPMAPMVYAVISNPSIVDNPDIRSYQPYVHGRCQPPALIPLHMYGIEVEVDCYLDKAFVTLTGTWRLHCVAASKCCDCRVAIPMGDQQVDGGSKLLVKARWSQMLLYDEGQFCLSLPFSFPEHVTPGGKFSKKEKILLNINSGTNEEVQCKTATHPLKELKHQVGKFGFVYEAEVDTWSQTDFEFSYAVLSSDIRGGLLLQSPTPNDFDQREMFALYLLPGEAQSRNGFRKRVIFLVDISGSMKGAPIENVKKALLPSLSELNQDDFFNIIAFNGEAHMFSSSMELATQEALQRASKWINIKLIAEGDTNILLPMKQALKMVSHEINSMSLIFLITDGAVENERDICSVVEEFCAKIGRSPLLCISTFGIGSYCNHYFLQMLAQIGRGHYDAAYDADSIASRLQRFYTKSSSVILSNIEVDGLNQVESLTLYPSTIQHLAYGCPVIISGRYIGKLPESLKLRGTLADMSNFTTDLKIRKGKDIPLDKVFARTQIDVLTTKAWFTGSKEAEKQVAEISMQTGIPSEYTRMILFRTDAGDQGVESIMIQRKEAYNRSDLQKMVRNQNIIPLQSLGTGFGDLKKTAENLPPGVIVKAPDVSEFIVKAATGCCHRMLDRICCMCFIQAVSKLSDRCVVTLSQICAALACFQCVDCCFDLCADCG